MRKTSGPTGSPSQQTSSTAPESPLCCFCTSCLNSYSDALGYIWRTRQSSLIVALGKQGVWEIGPFQESKFSCATRQTGQLLLLTPAIMICSSRSAIQAIIMVIVSRSNPYG